MPIIKAEGVTKTYDTGKIQVHALKEVSVSVDEGEMVAIMGPSGCGKTTLLNCLSGIDDIDSGAITIEDFEMSKMTDKKKTAHRAKRMGFMFQAYNLLPVLSAVENVELPILVSGGKSKEARVKALKALDMVGLKDRATHTPGEMSGGQQQRVAIARALVNDPAIIWADEPTGNLDTPNTIEVMELLCKLNQETDQTYVIVTHDPRVGQIMNRIIHMEDGLVKREEIPEHTTPCDMSVFRSEDGE